MTIFIFSWDVLENRLIWVSRSNLLAILLTKKSFLHLFQSFHEALFPVIFLQSIREWGKDACPVLFGLLSMPECIQMNGCGVGDWVPLLPYLADENTTRQGPGGIKAGEKDPRPLLTTSYVRQRTKARVAKTYLFMSRPACCPRVGGGLVQS